MAIAYAVSILPQVSRFVEMPTKVSAVEAAIWLDETGLLRNRKYGLSFGILLHAGIVEGARTAPQSALLPIVDPNVYSLLQRSQA